MADSRPPAFTPDSGRTLAVQIADYAARHPDVAFRLERTDGPATVRVLDAAEPEVLRVQPAVDAGGAIGRVRTDSLFDVYPEARILTDRGRACLGARHPRRLFEAPPAGCLSPPPAFDVDVGDGHFGGLLADYLATAACPVAFRMEAPEGPRTVLVTRTTPLNSIQVRDLNAWNAGAFEVFTDRLLDFYPEGTVSASDTGDIRPRDGDRVNVWRPCPGRPGMYLPTTKPRPRAARPDEMDAFWASYRRRAGA